MIAKRVIFEGRVQGVGFRYTTKDLARGFEVVGWVKNLPDGTVEMQAMGEKEELEDFLKEITEESAVSHHIQTVRTEAIPLLEGVRGFSIEK
ncbi:acylphosphatase [Luteolibacter sp. LG18]|uniref:acylphosphatase n=1 Tax=Luteolibacter sp. LG18 TaxID=2819286 RepID=UPI002B288C0E|nr:acylphosphatase [Luteolibacter sp. LG18]